MGDMTKNFSRHEFTCKCGCGFDNINPETVEIAQWVRDFVGVPVTITSGCRCKKHNTRVGGASRSQHLSGNAADLHVSNPEKVYNALCEKWPNKYGFGLYNTFVHVDCRTYKARWRG